MDRQSYFLAVALAYGALALLIAVSERPRRSTPMGMLVLAYAAIFAGCILQAFTLLPFWLNAITGNVLAWLGLIYQAWAILTLAGRPVTARYRMTVGTGLAVVVVVLMVAPVVLKYTGANLLYAVLFGYSAWALLTWRQATTSLRAVTAALFLASAVLYVLRALEFARGAAIAIPGQTPEFSPWVAGILFPLGFTTLISGAFGLLLLSRLQTEKKLTAATEELARLAAYDALTGLPNRRYFMDRAEAECSRADRGRQPLTIVIMDLDGLKEINDLQGHAVGDQAIQAVADACRTVLRELDTAARLGGDEFAILLPGSDLHQGEMVMLRVLEAMSPETPAPEFPRSGVTVSIGVAQYQPGESLDSVLARADAAMYESKRAGGGTVTRRDGGGAGAPSHDADADERST